VSTPELAVSPPVPPAFQAALDALRDVVGGRVRDGLELRIVPGPRTLAPWSAAVAAEVVRDDEDLASGRFVVLHDPDGQDGWQGDTRIVALVQADVDTEMAADPALAEVGWSWLLEALEEHGAAHTATGGTVTRTSSTRFGQIEDDRETCEVEIRASWTALSSPDGLGLGNHLLAWCDVLCSTAGLPPPGVTVLRP
jgi:hypothetical protein